MVCPNCAYDNSPNNRFCVRCGVDLSVAPSPETPSFAMGAGTEPAPPPPNPWGTPPPAAPWSAPGQTPPPPPPPYGSPPDAGTPNPFAQYPAYPPSGYQTASTNGLAIASFILGLVGWMACGVGSVVAVILGFVARSQIRNSHGRQGGDGLALAGIILGFLAIALVVLFFVIGSIANSNSGPY